MNFLKLVPIKFKVIQLPSFLTHEQNIYLLKAELPQEGIFFALNFLPREFLLIKSPQNECPPLFPPRKMTKWGGRFSDIPWYFFRFWLFFWLVAPFFMFESILTEFGICPTKWLDTEVFSENIFQLTHNNQFFLSKIIKNQKIERNLWICIFFLFFPYVSRIFRVLIRVVYALSNFSFKIIKNQSDLKIKLKLSDHFLKKRSMNWLYKFNSI